MNTTKQIATTTLIILLGVIAYGLFRTGSSMTTSQITTGRELSQAPFAIDQTPLYTAQRLAQMSTSADELPLAKEALRLGDREMDLAFAAAVSEARMHPVVLSAEAKQMRRNRSTGTMHGSRNLPPHWQRRPMLNRIAWKINWNRQKSKWSSIRMRWTTRNSS